MPLTKKEEQLLEDFYYDKGYTIGRDNLYKILVKEHPNEHPSRREVMAWLKDQETHQIYRGAKKSSGISSFRPIKPLNSLSADLIDLVNKPAKNYKYILVVVDNFSRFMWARAITTKEPSKVAPKMEDILNEIEEEFDKTPKYIQTDDGSEFKGEFLKLLNSRKVKNVRTLAAQPWSNALVERANGKLKSVLFKNKSIKGGNWFDNLKKAIEVYNEYVNRSTKYAPKDAIKLEKEGQDELKDNVKTLAIEQKTLKPTNYEVGQRVRKKIPKGKLDKGLSSPNWTQKTYTITKVTKGVGVRPTKYALSDNGNKKYTFNDVLAIKKVEKQPTKIVKKEAASPRRLRASSTSKPTTKRATRRSSRNSTPMTIARPIASSVGDAKVPTARVVGSTTNAKIPIARVVGSNKKIKQEDREYVVEKIVGYRESDKKVKVKWEGYKTLTWEPRSEFETKRVWKAYKKKNKIK